MIGKNIGLSVFVILSFILLSTVAFSENIDPGNNGSKYVYGENVGWINFKPSKGPGVAVSPTGLSGYAWGENIGWINLSPSAGGVLNDGFGRLSGYAWSENTGWINFAPATGGVFIDECGDFNGTAWGENIGWISMRSDGLSPFKISTSWTPPDVFPPTTTALGIDGGWYNANVSVSLEAVDNVCGSGVRDIRYTLGGNPLVTITGSTAFFTITEEGYNILNYFSTDNANNEETARLMTVKIDKTLPSVTLTTPPDASNYYVNSSVLADYEATDYLSGIGVITGTVPSGSPIDTGSIGTKSFTVTVIDSAGNSTTVTTSYTVAFPGNIDTDNAGCQYAYGENIGWINFKPSWGPGVTVTDTAVTGMAWGENIGWINLNPTIGGVVNDGRGELSGYAWGENVGWINFKPANGGVSIGSDGKLNGYAWGENIGWINFGSANSCVKTAWIRPDTTPEPFTFDAQTGVALDTVVTSNSITVAGVNAPAPISITSCPDNSCLYSIDEGTTWTSTGGTVSNGVSLKVRMQSAGTNSTPRTMTLDIGGVIGTFSVMTIAAPDLCPDDPNKTAPGICGCGVADTDADGDGTPDCNDSCPGDSNKITSGVCGCGIADTDTDGDGVPNCIDGCASDPLKISPGICGCGASDVDTDGDGTPDCNDGCPNDPNKTSPGVNGCGAVDNIVPPGTNVTVTPDQDITLTFDNVTNGGALSMTEMTNPSPPANFKIPSGKAYEVTFSGAFTGSVTICFHYDDQPNENNLKLMHRTATGWRDITSAGYPDTVNNIICGVTTSFSEFAVMEPLVVNQSPTCGRTAFVYSAGNTVSFTDTSTDDGIGGLALVSVNWGDTRADYDRLLLSPFSHSYAVAGTYLIMQTVKDARGAISECPRQYVTVSPAGAKYGVTVNMSKAATYATVKVLLNGSIKSQGSTGAAGLTWTSASLPANANYTLSVTKPGKTFSCNGATVDLSAGNQTVNCTVTP